VMIASTRAPIPVRQTLMADVARAVVRYHDDQLDSAAVVRAP